MNTFEQKTARNARVQKRYDELMREGKHGHYETMFRVVREEVEAALAAEPANLTNLTTALEGWKDALLAAVASPAAEPQEPAQPEPLMDELRLARETLEWIDGATAATPGLTEAELGRALAVIGQKARKALVAAATREKP